MKEPGTLDEDPSLPGKSLEDGSLASDRIPELVVTRVMELLRDIHRHRQDPMLSHWLNQQLEWALRHVEYFLPARVSDGLLDALAASGSTDWTPEEFASPHHVRKAAKLLDKELDGNTRACFEHVIPVDLLARRLLKYGADVTDHQVRRHLVACQVAWITREEDGKLEGDGQRSKRGNPRAAYAQAGIRLRPVCEPRSGRLGWPHLNGGQRVREEEDSA